jgi:DNA-binding transcriptional regulator YbjK
MTRERIDDPDIRKQQILEAAILVALKVGYKKITRKAVAGKAGVSTGLITNYFTPIDILKTEVLIMAVRKEIIELIAQGVGARDPVTRNLPNKLKKKVMEYLAN